MTHSSRIHIFRSFLLIFLTFGSIALMAQTGLVRGHAYDADSGEPITFGNAVLEGTTMGTNTDIDGFFTLTDVPVGTYNLQISFIGYETQTVEIVVKEGSIVYQKMMVKPGGVQLQAVDISARREVARTEVQISKLQVSQKQIKALPSTGGDADILQYLQVLPGVITTGDQGGQIFIRGGSPIQNKIMLDGMTIYNPFHSVGFYSVFETELIKNVDVLTGGFNAEHGGRISAVVDINTREGNKKRLAGQLSASPFSVKALIEGPIIKLQEDKGAVSFVLTGKRSIIDQASQSIYSYAGANDSIGLPFFFNDVYSKLSFVSNNGSKFNVFGFNFQDEYNDPSIARIGWQNSGGGMNFNILPSSSSLIVNGIAGFSDYKSEIEESVPRSSQIREFFVGLNFGFFQGNYELKYGIEIKNIFTNFNFTNQFNVNLEQFQSTTELSAFVKFRQAWDRLVIEPSVRLQYYASLPEASLEPRFGLKYNITDYLRFKLAAGIYSQNLISSSNERDVVNLFTGFLSGPDSRFNDLDGNPVTSKLQKSQHLVTGFEADVFKNFEVNLEGYIKNFPQLIIVNRNKVNLEDPNFATETGIAYGGDISIKYQTSNWYFWTTYSLGFVNRNDGEQIYRTIFDRRHNLNFLASYNFGEKLDWQVSARYNFGTGFPFTQTQSFYNFQPFAEGSSTPYETNNSNNIGIIFSDERNGGELPPYHRLDLSAQKTITFSKNLNAVVVASITNVTDRDNIFFFDRVRYERVNQLPILPSIGVKFNF